MFHSPKTIARSQGIDEAGSRMPIRILDESAKAEDVIIRSHSADTMNQPLFGDDDFYSQEADRKSRLSFSSSFSAIHPQNSAPLTTFLLINTMIGSGILNQPYVFYESGIVGGMLGFVLATIATWLGLVLMTAAGVKAGVYEYSGLAKTAFGMFGERLVDVSIVVLAFGSQLGYILVVGDTLSQLLISWGCTNFICEQMQVTWLAVGLFVTPLCLFRHFGHLAYLSIFSVFTIVLVLFLVYIGGPLSYEPGSGDVKVFDILGMVQSSGSIVFALSCAAANFQAFISTEKGSQNLTSWSKITGTAVLIGSTMCMTMGIAGYVSFRSRTNGEILNNFPGHAFDFFKAMVVCHLIMYIPVNFVIMRYSIVKLATGRRSELLPFSVHTTLSIFLLTLTTGTVLVLLHLGLASGVAFAVILNITGGIGGSLATLTLPAAIYLKLMPRDSSLYKPAICLAVFGVVVCVAVCTVTIISLVE